MKISSQEILFLCFIISIAIDTTPFLRFSVGPLQIGLPDILLGLLIYLSVADMAVKIKEMPKFSLIIFLFLMAAGLISLISYSYISSDYIVYDIKISMKLVEHAMLILVAGNIIRDFESFRRLLKILCLSSLFLSVLTILQSAGILFTGAAFVRRTTLQLGPFVVGTLALSDGVMGVSILTLTAFPFMIDRSVFKSLSVRSLFCFVTILAAIISFSRSLWVGLSIEVAMLFFLYASRYRMVYLKYLALLSPLVVVTLLGKNIEKVLSLLVNLRSSTVSGRLLGYFNAFNLVSSKPHYILFGAGKGQFFELQVASGKAAVAHNLFLDILISKGAITLIILITVFGTIFFNLLKLQRSHISAGNHNYKTFLYLCFVSLTGIFIESMFAPTTNSIQLWTAISVFCAFISISKKSKCIIL